MLEMNTAEKISQSKPRADAMPEEVGIEMDFSLLNNFEASPCWCRSSRLGLLTETQQQLLPKKSCYQGIHAAFLFHNLQNTGEFKQQQSESAGWLFHNFNGNTENIDRAGASATYWRF